MCSTLKLYKKFSPDYIQSYWNRFGVTPGKKMNITSSFILFHFIYFYLLNKSVCKVFRLDSSSNCALYEEFNTFHVKEFFFFLTTTKVMRGYAC